MKRRAQFEAKLLVLLGGFRLAGCASFAPVAPAVTPAMSAAAGGTPMATLEAGRHTFATQCTACHNAHPLGKYPAAEWRRIVAEMSPRAKLDAGQEQALLAYLLAAREVSTIAR